MYTLLSFILPDFDSFKVGDEVNCMLETRKPIGNGLVSINQKAFIGKIIDISGDEFSIKSKNKIYEFNRGEFCPIDAPGPIEYFRIGKCRCELDQEKSNG